MNKFAVQTDKILTEVDELLLSNPSKGFALLKNLEEQLQQAGQSVPADIRFKIAQIQNQLGLFEESENILLDLHKQFQLENNEKGLAKTSNELGNTYWERGDQNNALEYYLKSLRILEKHQEFHNMCIPLNNIGQIYWYNKDFEKARAAYQRSLELSKQYSPHLQADALTNLGILNAEEGEYAQAEKYYQQSLELYRQYNNQTNIALINVNLALLYEDSGRFSLAEEFHQKAIESFQIINKPFGEMHSLMNYAGFLINQQKFDQVKNILDQAHDLAMNLEAKNQLIQIYSHYRDFYKNIGNFAKAYEYLEKYHNMEIERLDSENREKLTEMLTRYETEKKEKEAQLLREQNEILTEKNREIKEQSIKIDQANKKLQKANLELENRLEDLLQKWREQEMIKRGEENLGGFNAIISSIAHQWKQPLNIIGLLMQNLIDAYEFEELNQKYLDNFHDQIFQQIKYMSDIVDDFAYGFRDSRLSNKFLLTHAVKLGKALINKTLKIENVDFMEDIQEDFQIAGDESKFIQVLMVILSNALEIFQENKQQQPRLHIKATRNKEHVDIEIFNSGPNIPDDILPLIFDVFFSTKSKKNNTGLGLTLAKKFVEEQLQGKISCFNRQDGVVFLIKLPLVQKFQE